MCLRCVAGLSTHEKLARRARVLGLPPPEVAPPPQPTQAGAADWRSQRRRQVTDTIFGMATTNAMRRELLGGPSPLFLNILSEEETRAQREGDEQSQTHIREVIEERRRSNIQQITEESAARSLEQAIITGEGEEEGEEEEEEEETQPLQEHLRQMREVSSAFGGALIRYGRGQLELPVAEARELLLVSRRTTLRNDNEDFAILVAAGATDLVARALLEAIEFRRNQQAIANGVQIVQQLQVGPPEAEEAFRRAIELRPDDYQRAAQMSVRMQELVEDGHGVDEARMLTIGQARAQELSQRVYDRDANGNVVDHVAAQNASNNSQYVHLGLPMFMHHNTDLPVGVQSTVISHFNPGLEVGEDHMVEVD
jgi:hypothetical protein